MKGKLKLTEPENKITPIEKPTSKQQIPQAEPQASENQKIFQITRERREMGFSGPIPPPAIIGDYENG